MLPGQLGATELLASVIARIEDPAIEGVSAGDFEALDNGVAATIHKPGGDRYRITIEWLGDREGQSA